MIKKIIKISLVIFGVLLLVGGFEFFSLSDLRSGNSNYPNSHAKAQQLMKEMGIAHNIYLWDSINSYTATYEDEFYGFLGAQSHPFKEQKMSFALSYIPKKYTGQLEVISGEEKGKVWGVQSGETYTKNKEGKVSRIQNKDMKFWIPTYQYFIEFPNRIQEATALAYIGSKIINGIETEGVLASWNTVEPQRDIDQYIIWMDKNSKRIVKVEYTIREMYGFISGGAYFQKYKDFNGMLLPTELPVESNLVEGILHKMNIVDFKPNQIEATLLPLN